MRGRGTQLSASTSIKGNVANVMSGESVSTSPTHGWSVSMMIKQGTEAEDTRRLSPNGSLTQRTKVQLEGSLDVGDPALRVDIIGFDLPRSLYFLLWSSTRVVTPFLRSLPRRLEVSNFAIQYLHSLLTCT